MRIVAAMSGGVDSSVAAHLLKAAGHEVIGCTLDLWPAPDEGRTPDHVGCCGAAAADDARHVCQRIGAPFYTVNAREEFERLVVEDFRAEYLRGRTPNPCIRCNTLIKFGFLLRLAGQLRAEAVATGHYARVDRCPQTGRWRLLRGLDRSKDQSYVLYGLSQEQLARALFPLGEWTKKQVRARAEQAGLRTHNRPESQEVCFVPDNDYVAFVERRGHGMLQPGRIVDMDGKFLGRHAGIHRFTLGQRRRLGVAVGRPRYVVDIDPATATVTVGPKEGTFRRAFTASSVNWVSIAPPGGAVAAQVQIRYTHAAAAALVTPLPGAAARIRFERPQSAITPGQAAVFYDADMVLGGGTIEAVEGREESQA